VDLRIEAPDSDRYQAALRHVGRPTHRGIRLTGAILIGFSLLFLLDSALTTSVMLSLRLAIAVLGAAFLVLGGLLAFARIRYSPDLSRLAAQPCSFELTHDYIRQTSPLHTNQMAWGAFIRFEEIPGQMLLFLTKRQYISVPTTDLTGDQLTELRRFIADRNADPETPPARTKRERG
jgi:hypothetical protein